MKQRRQNTGNHPDPLAEFAAVETVYVCSNSRCGAAWNADPHGHCPMCIGPQGHGWSTEARVVFALPASDEPALCFALGCRDLTGAIADNLRDVLPASRLRNIPQEPK